MSARTDKPYAELGNLLDSIARERNVRGPYSIANRVTDVTKYEVTGQAVSRCFYGSAWPRPGFIRAFAAAFDLSEEERDTLAWFYTYGSYQNERPTTKSLRQ